MFKRQLYTASKGDAFECKSPVNYLIMITRGLALCTVYCVGQPCFAFFCLRRDTKKLCFGVSWPSRPGMGLGDGTWRKKGVLECGQNAPRGTPNPFSDAKHH